MFIRYFFFAIVSIIADLLAFVLAPIAALPIFVRVRGGREYLIPLWSWITTHDAPVDAGRIDRYFTTKSKYLARVYWIWRNPAYQVGHWLGYDQRGAVITKHSDNATTWDSGVPNKAYWTAINHKWDSAFLYECQFYYYKQWCIELQFGWKLYRKDPDEKCMLAMRISPFKRYDLKTTH